MARNDAMLHPRYVPSSLGKHLIQASKAELAWRHGLHAYKLPIVPRSQELVLAAVAIHLPYDILLGDSDCLILKKMLDHPRKLGLDYTGSLSASASAGRQSLNLK